jgi:flavin reductase (DIM6/NTAB) family NADH-FMN oxidoreductase RutF
MTADAFAAVIGSLDPPMIVVTAAVGDERAGCLVGFHSQASIDPERYCVWLSKANHTYRVALLANHLGVHALTEHDRDLAVLFGTRSGDEVDKFTLTDVEDGPEGVPLLPALPHRMVVRKTSLLDDGGDHVCLVTAPVDVATPGPFTPLRLSAVAHLTPGHEAAERPRPATERAGGA